MNCFRRFLYLVYYCKKLDRATFWRFFRVVRAQKHWPGPKLFRDIVCSVFRYNISLMEYFYFRFYERDPEERKGYAGTGYMYEYQLLMNPRKYREALEDKRRFLELFRDFVRHDHADLDSFEKNPELAKKMLGNKSGKLVLKKHNGQCGIGVELFPVDGMGVEDVLGRLKETGNDLVEECITQHPDLMALSPSGLNTIRIFTQLNSQDEVEILGCRLRISVDSVVDNFAAGNIAAPVDEESGVISGEGVYSDITKANVEIHPITGVRIPGFRIPFWKETLEMVKKAALFYPQCRSVGWDVAVTSDGPGLIEANHDWCKLVWQLPVDRGLKEVLERHLREYRERQSFN